MNKKINFSSKGRRADIGNIVIERILPNRYADAVGPFVFLDHIGPTQHDPAEPVQKNGNGAHPHRGIATLTYIINGEEEHFDSKGNYGKINSGGIQWMKAGNGIVHDGNFNVDPQTGDQLTHGFQFWINLPAKNKVDPAMHIAIQASDVPMKNILGGWIKLIAGDLEELHSTIPAYSKQFIYHIHLEPNRKFSIASEPGLEYSAFVLLHQADINSQLFQPGEFIEFDPGDGLISITSKENGSDIIVFGGAPYTEPIVAHGPFVMNTQEELAQAYHDFHLGKYGKLDLVQS